jgi:SAM-dependent methyltransferase
MDEHTLKYYDENSSRLALRYEEAGMEEMHQKLLCHLKRGGSVLEIGCGSGRDAAFLLSKGFDITAVDVSGKMIGEAVAHHPELNGQAINMSFPFKKDNPLLGNQYDGVVMIATLMHIPEEDLFESGFQIKELLREEGILFLSVSVGRMPKDMKRDREGRLYLERHPDSLQLLFERLGLRFVAKYQNRDTFSRDFEWVTLVMQKQGGGETRSIDEIQTIISHDRKDATYKLALLRALCDIAQLEHFQVEWMPDGRVRVPLGLVAEKWLLYYWPIIERDEEGGKVVIPQKRGMEVNKPIAFRKAMRDLISFYSPLGGLNSFAQDYRANTLTQAGAGLVDIAMNSVAHTIVAGPVAYAGGSLKGSQAYFRFEGRRRAKGRCTSSDKAIGNLGCILVSSGTWREMSLIGHWISESLIIRWAELTNEISNKLVAVKDVIEKLLIRPVAERNVQFSKSIYKKLPGLECVWTGVKVADSFAIDHAIPFSLWFNNDLWNLFPAASGVNAKKSDRLVSGQTLKNSRDRIIYYWEVIKANTEERFLNEINHALLRKRVERNNWQIAAFSGLVENVEILAIQRGLERWEP